MPAIVASAAIVFAISIDDFVISEWLSSGADTDTVPIRIYSATRGAPLPSTNAHRERSWSLITLPRSSLGFLVYRFFTRGTSGAAATRPSRDFAIVSTFGTLATPNERSATRGRWRSQAD